MYWSDNAIEVCIGQCFNKKDLDRMRLIHIDIDSQIFDEQEKRIKDQ